ncbi:MAG: HEAT repeat domain-containing protein [Planctomycetota bacterium]
MQPARADPDELAARLQGQDAATRAAAADALAALSRRAAVAVPALGNVLSDVEPQVRWRAAWALARIGEPAAPAAPALVERLGDDERAVRFAAAVALSRLGAVVVPRLAQVLQDPTSNANAREAAALALERLGPPAAPALPALRDAVRARQHEAARAEDPHAGGPRPGCGTGAPGTRQEPRRDGAAR